MRRFVLARRRALHVCVGFAGGACRSRPGCAAPGRASASAAGRSRCMRARRRATANTQSAADVLAAEQLAFDQCRDQARQFTLRFIKLDGVKALRQRPHRDRGHQRDRLPRRARSWPVCRFAGHHQRAGPAAGRPRPTPRSSSPRRPPAVPNSPEPLLRVAGQLRADVRPGGAEHSARGQGAGPGDAGARVSKLYVASDGSQYGRAIAQAVRSDAPASSITIAPSSIRRRRGLLRRESRTAAAAQVFNSAAAGDAAVKLFGPSALDSPTFAARAVADRPPRLHLVARVPDQGSERHGQSEFLSRFEDAYHRRPSPQAIFGYEAMSAVLVGPEEGRHLRQRSRDCRPGLLRDQEPRLGARHVLDQRPRGHEPRAVRLQPPVNGQARPLPVRASAGVRRGGGGQGIVTRGGVGLALLAAVVVALGGCGSKHKVPNRSRARP